MSEQPNLKERPFVGSLNAVDAANAIRASRLTALDLLDTAELLYSFKRFSHSMALSILAIEESAKCVLLFSIFLNIGDRLKGWKSYRNHHAKTSWLNFAIRSRVQPTFPDIPLEHEKEIEKAGPTSEQLEISKQRAIYSDCLEISGEFVAHSPREIEWRKDAWHRLCEAQALCHSLRNHPPEELQVWKKYTTRAANEGKNLASLIPELHKELLKKGIVQEGWWDMILEDIAQEFQSSDTANNFG